MKRIARLCLLIVACLPFQVQGQMAVGITADSALVETGNPYVLHISVSGERTPDSLNFGLWQEFIAPQNVLSQSGWGRKGNKLTIELSLLFFEADTITLPPLAVTFDHSDTIYSAPYQLVIYPTPSPDDLNDMAPIKDIRREPVLWTDYLPMAAAIVGTLAILGLLFWWYSRGKKRRAFNRTLELPPHELALKKLDILHKKSLWSKGAIKEYCAEITHILREYLEKRYHLPALESTSEELLLQLGKTDFPGDLKPDLENILTQADLAKFAKATPSDEFHVYSFDFAMAMVHNTIAPVEEENSAEGLA